MIFWGTSARRKPYVWGKVMDRRRASNSSIEDRLKSTSSTFVQSSTVRGSNSKVNKTRVGNRVDGFVMMLGVVQWTVSWTSCVCLYLQLTVNKNCSMSPVIGHKKNQDSTDTFDDLWVTMNYSKGNHLTWYSKWQFVRWPRGLSKCVTEYEVSSTTTIKVLQVLIYLMNKQH